MSECTHKLESIKHKLNRVVYYQCEDCGKEVSSDFFLMRLYERKFKETEAENLKLIDDKLQILMAKNELKARLEAAEARVRELEKQWRDNDVGDDPMTIARAQGVADGLHQALKVLTNQEKGDE